MTKSIKQLREEIAVLETTISVLAYDIEEVYRKYLECLPPIVGRQLILATYHICTQKYPEHFLKLSFQERHNLQQNIQKLPTKFREILAKDLIKIEYFNSDYLRKLTDILVSETSRITNNSNIDNENQENTNIENEENQEENRQDSNLQTEEKEKSNSLNPDQLTRFSLEMDLCIHNSIIEISQLANKYLQRVDILPRHLPSKILEMALQSEERASVMSEAPNLLSLLVERELRKDEDQKQRDITAITAVCLRLSELEFADPNLTMLRSQIREIFTKIENISDKYRKKQHSYAIAQAESAWRTSWTELE
jgi:hypothetical protein